MTRMKQISDELFALLVRYHLSGDTSRETADRIHDLLSQKIGAIADRNRYRQEHYPKKS